MTPPTTPTVVVLTGPECTGKTTLAEWIARAYDTACSPEYARAYADAHPILGADDVAPIARGQIASEDAAAAEAAAHGRPLVVRDTDLVSTVVYARHYYGACPSWIEDAARARRGALYLLCAPDVPWVADGVRDRPHARDAMLDEFRAALESLGGAYIEVRGTRAEREAAVRQAVDGLIVTRDSSPSPTRHPGESRDPTSFTRVAGSRLSPG